MAENTKISWCDHTVNLWWGCSKVHTGCKNCYAETLSKRFDNDIWGNDKNRKLIKSAFKDLDKYQKQAGKENKKVTVFIGSMMDIFELNFPLQNPNLPKYENTDELRNRLFRKINNNEYPNIIFLFLTKRPENIGTCLVKDWYSNPPKNVWIGTSLSEPTNKQSASILNREWKGKKFLSIEPQTKIIRTLTAQDKSSFNWVIQGCESGSNARPFNIEWAYKMKEECKRLGIPYFLKQIQDEKGKLIKDVEKFPNDLKIREFPIW